MREIRPSSLPRGVAHRSDPITGELEWDTFVTAERAQFLLFGGRSTTAYSVGWDLDASARGILRLALDRWADEDLDLESALRWAAERSPHFQRLLAAEWAGVAVPDLDGLELTARFDDDSMVRMRVRSGRGLPHEADLVLPIWLTTQHFRPAQVDADSRALHAISRQVGLMKAGALMAGRTILHAPPGDSLDERQWVVFATGLHPFGWNVRDADRESIARVLASDSRLQHAADEALLVSLRTDVQQLRAAGLIDIASSEKVYLAEWKDSHTLAIRLNQTPPVSYDDHAHLEARRALRRERFARAAVLPAVLDAESWAALDNADGPSTPASSATLAQLVAGVSALYVVKSLPHIAHHGVDEVLEWRSALAPSFEAFRSRVAELVADMKGYVADDDAIGYLRAVGPRLDQDLHDLKGAAVAAGFWKTAKERTPVGVGVGGGIALQLMFHGKPLMAAAALLQGTVAQGLTTVGEMIRRTKNVRSNALYWRLSIDKGDSRHDVPEERS